MTMEDTGGTKASALESFTLARYGIYAIPNCPIERRSSRYLYFFKKLANAKGKRSKENVWSVCYPMNL